MLNFKKLHITYCNPHSHNDTVILDYQIRSTPIAEKWVERVLTAQKSGYTIDNPARFYGFGSIEEQTIAALSDINKLIIQLNTWTKIDYSLQSVTDQDTLNKLHHIFEIEHGLLDKKDLDPKYKQALCDLNLLVHRCESIARGAHPRHVVTYYGLPKTKTLTSEDYKYFESAITFGTVYINYAEIGKTLQDLMMDNDSYIHPEAFQPFCHYSADFVVKFWEDAQENLHRDLYAYYQQHRSFFETLGYSWQQLSCSIGSIPVANLCTHNNVLELLNTHQYVKAVDFS